MSLPTLLVFLVSQLRLRLLKKFLKYNIALQSQWNLWNAHQTKRSAQRRSIRRQLGAREHPHPGDWSGG